MYLPSHFRSDDPHALDALDALVARDAFATIVSVVDDAPFVSHLPISLARDGGRVIVTGHFAKANPHWRLADGRHALVILHGPHAHVSPSWYERPETSVPTWNYVVAHLRGRLRTTDDPAVLESLVTTLAETYEPKSGSSWRFEDVTPETRGQLRGIVGFELVAETIDVKRKLSQHHSIANLRGAAAGLDARGQGDDREVAALMNAVADAKAAAAEGSTKASILPLATA